MSRRTGTQKSGTTATMTRKTDPDRAMAERLHAIVKASAPVLSLTWYGMPVYDEARIGALVKKAVS
jgi:hypothetical protein